MSEVTGKKEEVRSQTAEESAGPDFCRGFCTDCKRPICTGAKTLGKPSDGETFIETPNPLGAVAVPGAWWTANDTRMAIASNDDHLAECHGQCDGDFDSCPLPGPNCDAVGHCRWCHYWVSTNGEIGMCEDPGYDGKRKRLTKAGNNMCMQFVSRWESAKQGDEAEAIIKEANRRFRVTQVRHGDVGEETHYLRIIDRDGDPGVFFSDSAAVAWQGPAHKASVLVDLIKEATGDSTVRVEEVPHA